MSVTETDKMYSIIKKCNDAREECYYRAGRDTEARTECRKEYARCLKEEKKETDLDLKKLKKESKRDGERILEEELIIQDAASRGLGPVELGAAMTMRGSRSVVPTAPRPAEDPAGDLEQAIIALNKSRKSRKSRKFRRGGTRRGGRRGGRRVGGTRKGRRGRRVGGTRRGGRRGGRRVGGTRRRR